MQQTVGLKIFSLVTMVLLNACVTNDPINEQNSTGSGQARSIEQIAQIAQEPTYDAPVEEVYPSCSRPAPDDAQTCQQIEQQILGYTVRIEIEAWIKHPVGHAGMFEYRRTIGNGHATIKDGRYLVTHNHFDVPASVLADLDAIEFGAVSIYTADGHKVDSGAQPLSLNVAAGDPESLVLDFGTVGGEGYFAALGLPSAQFVSWGEIQLEPGAEVAQVDWDGSTTNVRWATVESIVTDDGPPRLVLSGGIKQGASGGGVFLNGYHVANNWTLRQYVGVGGDVQGESSTAALNSADLLAAADL
jgi:hypothetical protein